MRRIRRNWVPALAGLGLFVFSSVARATVPPPIPSSAERGAFIQAEESQFARAKSALGTQNVHDQYDVTHYDVTLGLNIGAKVLTGTVIVEATAQIANLSSIQLDLYSPMVVDGVLVNGAAAPYNFANNLITVTLDHTYQPNQAFEVTCSYHGTPAYSGAPFRWNTHGSGVPMILSYSEPYGAPAWWVCKDDCKDKATFSIHVTGPDTLVTVSNGLLQSVVHHADHTATYNWATNYPMSDYLFSIATTNFEKWSAIYTALDHLRQMEVDYYAYPEDFANSQGSWGRNIQMMQYYASIFGEFPFLSEKYAIAEFEHTGAMEHQTATSMGWTYVTGSGANDYVVAHELSHSWVGDMITMRSYAHAWIKEGFATHCEALYFEHLYGTGYYHAYMDSMNVLAYALKEIYNVNPPLDPVIYYKGGWVLHMLRHVIGDNAYFAGVRGYANNPNLMYGNAVTEDLRDAFAASSGMNLDWFFTEWIYNPGYPVYLPHWQATPSGGGYDVQLSLTQTQTVGPIFKMPIDVAVGTADGPARFVVWDSLQVQSFTLHVDSQPQNVMLDPDHWLIYDLDAASGANGAQLSASVDLRACPNPFLGETSLSFSLPGRVAARLGIFDLTGRLVRSLVQSPSLESGPHLVLWDGRDDEGRALPAGVYYQRLDAGGRKTVGSVVRIR